MNRAAMPTKTFLLWIGIILLAVLQACGGGGTRGTTLGGGSTDPNAAPAAASMQLLVGSPTVGSAGDTTVGLTAVVLDANNRALAGKRVTLRATDPSSSAFLSTFSSADDATDANGLFTARLNVGNNQANRTITVTATADSVSDTGSVSVIGTALTIAGSTSLVTGASTPLTISLKDSAGNAMVGLPLTVSSSRGNTLSPAAGTTNQNGQLIVTVTGTSPGADTITVSGSGATATTTLAVSGSDFSFASPSPAAESDVVVNTSQPLRVRWFENGSPQANRVITFSATRGILTSSSVTTDSNGLAQTSIISSSAGAATVTASAPSGTPSTTLNFVFVTTTASVISVQSNRSTLAVNASGADTSRATISAVVRDSANNLVKNARVEFQIVQDTTGGRLAAGSDITDVSGTATVDYIAGTISSDQNGVQIRARVADVGGTPVATTVSNTVSLTVARQSLFIRLETDNKVLTEPPTYTKKFVALVTDAAGNPQVGVRVQFEVNPAQPPATAYAKGYWVVAGGVWAQRVLASCYNEDVNLNGIVDPFVREDINYNGILDLGEDLDGNSRIGLRNPTGATIGRTGLFLGAEFGDLNSDGDITDTITEDVNGNDVLDPGEDINGNGQIDVSVEDANRNGIVEPAEELHAKAFVDIDEDFDRSGANGRAGLTPGNVATATTDILTDSRGMALSEIVYAQNFAYWATVTLQAKVSVAGSESLSVVTFTLPGLAADFIDADVSPPGRISPFGVRRNCADYL